MLRTLPSQVLRLIATISMIAILTAHPTTAAPQKAAPSSPQSQAQLEERVKELEKRLDAAEQKAASAAMEKDYITRVQKQYETYYKEVLSTQTWTIGIFGLVLTALLIGASIFSFNVFDSRTKSAIGAALTEVENRNASQLKTLEDGLTKRISQQEEDLKNRSSFQFGFAQGMAVSADKRYAEARRSFRRALEIYKLGKARQLIPRSSGVNAVRNVFVQLYNEDHANFTENARLELADPLYSDLEEELALAVGSSAGASAALGELGELLRERK
jgi:hypothetical protein